MRLFRDYLRDETARCVANGVRLEIIGRRDRLGAALRRAIEEAHRETAHGTRLHLRIALDYSVARRDAPRRAVSPAGRRADQGVLRPPARHRGPRRARCPRSIC